MHSTTALQLLTIVTHFNNKWQLSSLTAARSAMEGSVDKVKENCLFEDCLEGRHLCVCDFFGVQTMSLAHLEIEVPSVPNWSY